MDRKITVENLRLVVRPREEDTPLEIRLLQWEIIRQKPLEERLRMTCEMADLGQRAVRDRLRRRNPCETACAAAIPVGAKGKSGRRRFGIFTELISGWKS